MKSKGENPTVKEVLDLQSGQIMPAVSILGELVPAKWIS
jgi:hypothetical protein